MLYLRDSVLVCRILLTRPVAAAASGVTEQLRAGNLDTILFRMTLFPLPGLSFPGSHIALPGNLCSTHIWSHLNEGNKLYMQVRKLFNDVLLTTDVKDLNEM